ncbi:hypothetical protein B0H13DRAFT_1894367 [Mycena leptocephala]|nr:hypothetical protein B0H13DRAFT_1894367 [Mycena leptocephala]
MIHHKDAPPTHCHSNSAEQHYNMFDNQCKYHENPCQQPQEPLLGSIANTTQSLLKNMETVKQNKNECAQLLEQTYELLNTILMVYITSDMGGELPPSVLKHIGKFRETLQKIHTFVEAQQNGSKIKKFFRQGEMSTLLKDCKAGLQQGLEIFQVPMVNHMNDITQMQGDAESETQKFLT